MIKQEVIYCLAEIGGEPFYVGKTVDPHTRWHSHIRSAKTGVEAKYQHIRALWAKGSDFELIIIDHNPKERYEKYYHYLLGFEYDLTNMKMGDKHATRRAFENEINDRFKRNKREFKSADEYLSVYDRELKEHNARKKAAATQRKIRCDNSDVSRTIFKGEDPNVKFASRGVEEIRARLRAEKELQRAKAAEWAAICRGEIK